MRISLRIKNRPTWLGGAGGGYKLSDLTEKDLDEAFYWFGILAFVISVLEWLVGYLGDERMHEYRNKPGYGLVECFKIKNIDNNRRYFFTKVKLLFKPKIVEKR